MTTYTEHKLTDAMLRKLSRLRKGPADFYSGTGDALVSRGLAEGGWDGVRPIPYSITDAGREALEQARKEGW